MLNFATTYGGQNWHRIRLIDNFGLIKNSAFTAEFLIELFEAICISTKAKLSQFLA